MSRTILNCDESCRVLLRVPMSRASASWSCWFCGLRCRVTESLFEREPHKSRGVLFVMQTCVMASVRASPSGLLIMMIPRRGCMSGEARRVFVLGVVVGGWEKRIFFAEMMLPISNRRRYLLRAVGNVLYGGTVE